MEGFLHSPLGATYSYISYSPTVFPQHNEAEHKPALTSSFHPEMCHSTGSAPNLTIQKFNRIIRPNLHPMFVWKIIVGQSFVDALRDLLCDLFQFHPLNLGDYSRSFFSRSLFTLLCMNCFQYFCHKP